MRRSRTQGAASSEHSAHHRAPIGAVESTRGAGKLPTGTITFLFTDVEGSTRAWLREPEAMAAALARHDALIERIVAEHNGGVVRPRGEGDSRFAVFARATDAASAACAIQGTLAREPWPLLNPLRVRIALHTGEADLRLHDYYGPAVNHCARLRSLAHGGQVLMSSLTAELVRRALPPEGTLRDLGLHRLKDIDEPEHVWQLVHPDLQSEFPSLQSATPRTASLPVAVSSFHGRARELRELHGLVASTRLVTLIGPGGVGKTRLALELASLMESDFQDGVRLAELGSTQDAGLVPQSIAAALGVAEDTSQSMLATVVDAMYGWAGLLIIDNCEHVIAACADVANRLVHACPRLHILATSREPLGVAGEVTFVVAPLNVHSTTTDASADDIAAVEAVQLFLARARARQPGFELNPSTAPYVLDVCRRLDGLPLAIELAAARVAALSVHQIATRLSDRFGFLVGSTREAPARQRTLRAVLDWSYELLEQPERNLLERLSVFVGGWSLETAEAFVALDAEPPDVLDVLARLVDKSLVMTEPIDSGNSLRYTLLETVREYALARLLAQGRPAVEVARGRHAAVLLALAERANAEYVGTAQFAWRQELEREHDNLRAALNWALEHGSAETAWRLGAALWAFWATAGYVSEGRDWLERILACTSNHMEGIKRAPVLVGAGALAFQQGDLDAADAYCRQAQECDAELADDVRHRAFLLYGRGALAQRSGDLSSARALLETGIDVGRRTRDGAVVAVFCMLQLAELHLSQREPKVARDWAVQALDLATSSGSPQARGMALLTLGMLSYQFRELDAALDYLEASATVGRELGRGAWWVIYALLNQANVAIEQNDYTAARSSLRESLQRWQELGNPATLARVLIGCAHFAVAQGRAAAALRLASAAEQLRITSRRPLSPMEQQIEQRWLAPAREALGDSAAQAARRDGMTGAQEFREMALRDLDASTH